ncbi:MAG: lytic transglycosylase domain-containing protein [Chitinophagaceae bacterium]|nr:MAG: lytic transglycosylase domain-containing protein [Chitinophagaceae bacterium]
MKKLDTIFTIICSAGLCLLLISQFAFKSNANANPFRTESADAEWRPPALPEQLSFAGEAVPLERWDVKERLDREVLFNAYNRANILFLLKLSNRYFPIISERLKAAGVPDDFKYLCIAESNLLPGAVSGVGATGFWQFMGGTAPGYGLEANSQVDERMDVAKSTDAACQYLKTAYAKFGTWTAAAASYNCGMGGYNGQATFQQTKYYYDLHLPEETNRYLFRILAFKHILENADALGFKVDDKDLYSEIPVRTVTVTSSIPNLAQFAIDNGTTYKILRLLNPWIRGKSLPVKSGKSYTVKLPVKSS